MRELQSTAVPKYGWPTGFEQNAS